MNSNHLELGVRFDGLIMITLFGSWGYLESLAQFYPELLLDGFTTQIMFHILGLGKRYIYIYRLSF